MSPSDTSDRGPLRVVVMGVSGAGKSTIGALLAAELGAEFVDADSLHDDAARAKMAGGTPLTDEDRLPWLGRVGDRLAASTDPVGVVIACSALRRRYRDAIRASVGGRVAFVLLELDAATLGERLDAREDHFMPASLLASQLATLEPLAPDEDGVTVSAAGVPAAIVAEVLRQLG